LTITSFVWDEDHEVVKTGRQFQNFMKEIYGQRYVMFYIFL